MANRKEKIGQLYGNVIPSHLSIKAYLNVQLKGD